MEEIHQQPSIKISVLPVPRLVEINNLFGQCLEGGSFRKLLKSLYPCHQTIESVAQSGFSSTSKNYWSSIGTWGERTRFYFSRYSVMTCHKLSHFNSRVFTLYFSRNCCRLLEAKKFSRNPGQFNWVTSKTRYHVSIAELLKRNHISPVAELFWRPRSILNILCFSGDNQFLQTAP